MSSAAASRRGFREQEGLLARIATLDAEAKAQALTLHCTNKLYESRGEYIAELEAAAKTSICIFCGTTMEKDINVMLAHAEECEERPENELMRRIAELDARIEELNHVVAPLTAMETEAVKALGPLLEAGDALHRAEQAEAELAQAQAKLWLTEQNLAKAEMEKRETA